MSTKLSDLTKVFYTIRETSLILNVGDKTIRRWLKRGLLRSAKVCRKKLIPRTDVDNFFERTSNDL